MGWQLGLLITLAKELFLFSQKMVPNTAEICAAIPKLYDMTKFVYKVLQQHRFGSNLELLA